MKKRIDRVISYCMEQDGSGYSRIKKALSLRVLPNDLTIHQVAFNLLTQLDPPIHQAEAHLWAALKNWADTVLEEGPNGERRWEDDGGFIS
jgi:hypothetical protein